MKHQVKKIKNCKYQVKIEVDDKTIESRFEEVFREFQKQARLKGFREGKAPMDLVRATYAAEAEQEVIKSLVSESYYSAIRDSKLFPVGSPSVTDLKLERGKKLSFTAEFETAPQFNVKNYKGVRVAKPEAAVTEEDVTKALERIRETRAELEPVVIIRPIQEGDVLRCDVEVAEAGGAFKPARKDALFAVDTKGADADVAGQLIGANAGETRDITGEFSEAEKASGLVGRKPLYRIAVKEIQTKKYPELDDAFASTLGKPTLEELKAEIRTDLVRLRDEQTKDRMKQEIFGELLKANDLELPESLVERQKERIIGEVRGRAQGGRENGHSAPKSEEEAKHLNELDSKALERAREQVKLFFILEKIAEQEKIEPSADEVEARVRELAAQTGRPEQEIREALQDDIYQNLKQSKTSEYLLANASVKGEDKK